MNVTESKADGMFKQRASNDFITDGSEQTTTELRM